MHWQVLQPVLGSLWYFLHSLLHLSSGQVEAGEISKSHRGYLNISLHNISYLLYSKCVCMWLCVYMCKCVYVSNITLTHVTNIGILHFHCKSFAIDTFATVNMDTEAPFHVWITLKWCKFVISITSDPWQSFLHISTSSCFIFSFCIL